MTKTQNGQKSSFFNICCCFVVFWAKWAKLPTFAQFCLPEISRGLWDTLSKFEKKQKNQHYLSDLSDRNFCQNSKIFTKNQNSNT